MNLETRRAKDKFVREKILLVTTPGELADLVVEVQERFHAPSTGYPAVYTTIFTQHVNGTCLHDLHFPASEIVYARQKKRKECERHADSVKYTVIIACPHGFDEFARGERPGLSGETYYASVTIKPSPIRYGCENFEIAAKAGQAEALKALAPGERVGLRTSDFKVMAVLSGWHAVFSPTCRTTLGPKP